MPRPRTAAAALAAALLAAAPAAADVTVLTDLEQTGAVFAERLVVAVTPVAGPDGDHALSVEPFADDRDGWRVAQTVAGVPPIRAASADCLTNPFLNDVVCDDPRRVARITGGDGADAVLLREVQRDPGVCLAGDGPDLPPATPVAVDVRLGRGDDTFAFVPEDECAGAGIGNAESIAPTIVARGEAGEDRLTGGHLDDVLDGGEDDDGVSGAGGDDRLAGGPGDDTLSGGPGDDSFAHEAGSDRVDGGAGEDSMSYADTTGAVAVDLDQPGGDGVAAEPDNILPSVEKVFGGPSRDVIRGASAVDNHLIGGQGDDTLEGRSGEDRLSGGAGEDTLRGGNDPDALDGGAGRDTADGGPGLDGISYLSTTGPVRVDLVDPGDDGPAADPDAHLVSVENVVGGRGDDLLAGNALANRLTGFLGRDDLRGLQNDDALDGGPGGDTLDGGTGSDALTGGLGDDLILARDATADAIDCGDGTDTVQADLVDPVAAAASCETVVRAAIDDVAGARVEGRVLRRTRPASLRVACPATARVPCRGTLTLQRDGRVIGASPYRLGLGRRATVRVRIRGALPPAGARVTATTRERGISRKGPRQVVRVLVAGPVRR